MTLWAERSRHFLGVFCLLLPFSLSGQTSQSVLAEGDWYKIGITKSGLYKIDGSFLRKAGINPGSINPRQLRLYGNSGGMLPQLNAAPRADDLTENAIYVEGEADEKFDNNDFILFYAQGSHPIHYDSLQKQFAHRFNLYSDTAYYFLTLGNAPGLRVKEQPSLSGATQTITRFDDYFFAEKDLVNILRSGREWYGERFDVITEHHYDFTIPGLTDGVPLQIRAAVMAQGASGSRFTVKLNGQPAGTISVPGTGQGTYDVKGANANGSFAANVAGPAVRLSVSMEKTGAATGYVNQVSLQVKRDLRLSGSQTAFQSLQSTQAPVSRYQISQAPADVKVWEITNPQRPRNQTLTRSDAQAQFEAKGDTLRQFVLFSGTAFDNPSTIRKIENQNLHGLATPTLLIITPDVFIEPASRLAAFRREHDGLRVEVASLPRIYNEFASGRPDVTAIRDFIRFLYRKSAGLQYVLLVGDASYDYKNRLSNNTNFVPTYESYQSLHPIFSYSSDDYFGFLEDHEGEWTENTQGDHTMEVSVGRLPVKSASEAEAMVSKLIHYAQSPATTGVWRKRVCFVADDGDGNTHQQDADRLATQISSRYSTYTVDKIFMDAYPQVSTPAGQQAPAVVRAIDQAVDQGHLIINYTGHGGDVGWAQEQILSIPQIAAWKNANRLPLLVTATCEFGRYDDPTRTSGAEYAVLHPKGGAIGLITTTRPVFSNTNYALNVAFYRAIFEPLNGSMPRLGDAMRETKNNSLTGSINRNFTLLGDPSMRLAYPQETIVVTGMNGKPLTAGADTLKALARVTWEGEIRNTTGTLSDDFNGILYATLFDKPAQVTTLGDEGAKMTFQIRQNRLFEGKALVKNGRFTCSFVVPKDIDYRLGNGRLSLYARQEGTTRDAGGAEEKVLVGGSTSNPVTDLKPPDIKLFLNDTTFVNGGLTAPQSWLIAQLSDESGINISRTHIGHEITARLDSEEAYILNTYFSASPGDFRSGEVLFPLPDLKPGPHQITLKAWDTYNNSSEATLQFVVTAGDVLQLEDVTNYPNPFRDHTTFRFRHSRAGEALQTEIQLFSVAGKLMHTLRKEGISSSVELIEWDGRTQSGNKLEPGLYIYRLLVRCMADNTTSSSVNRLVLVR